MNNHEDDHGTEPDRNEIDGDNHDCTEHVEWTGRRFYETDAATRLMETGHCLVCDTRLRAQWVCETIEVIGDDE